MQYNVCVYAFDWENEKMEPKLFEFRDDWMGLGDDCVTDQS